MAVWRSKAAAGATSALVVVGWRAQQSLARPARPGPTDSTRAQAHMHQYHRGWSGDCSAGSGPVPGCRGAKASAGRIALAAVATTRFGARCRTRVVPVKTPLAPATPGLRLDSEGQKDRERGQRAVNAVMARNQAKADSRSGGRRQRQNRRDPYNDASDTAARHPPLPSQPSQGNQPGHGGWAERKLTYRDCETQAVPNPLPMGCDAELRRPALVAACCSGAG